MLSLHVRDLLLASWPTERERVARVLPLGLEPAEIDGRHLVSLAAFRCRGGRLGRLPVPPFSQLSVRAYVRHRGEQAVFFLATRVTLLGMGGALFGAPYRPARLRFRAGKAEASGLGVAISYEREGPTDPGEIVRHELGLFEAAGLRGVRVRRGEALWERGEATGEARAEILLAHGFEASGLPEVLYAEHAFFEAELPRKLA